MSEEKVVEQAGEVDPTGAVVTPEEGAAVESVPEEKPETEQEENEKFLQQRHQTMMAELTAQYGPDAVQKLKDGAFAAEQPPAQPSTEPSTESPESAISGEPDDYVTVAQQQASEKRLLDALTARDAERDQRQQLASLQTRYDNEYNAALAAVDTIVKDLKIPEDVKAQLYAEVNGFGIDMNRLGGPSGYAAAFHRLAKGYQATPETPATPPDFTVEEIAVLDKARQAGLMGQPTSAPVSATTLTVQQKAADDICEDDVPKKFT